MGYLKREIIGQGRDCSTEKIIIDFNGGLPPELQKTIVSSPLLSTGKQVGVVVVTSGCTGIAGSFTVNQSAEATGSPSFAMAPATTIALAASAAVAAGVTAVLPLALSHLVIDGSTVTWPTDGKMTISIVSKN